MQVLFHHLQRMNGRNPRPMDSLKVSYRMSYRMYLVNFVRPAISGKQICSLVHAFRRPIKKGKNIRFDKCSCDDATSLSAILLSNEKSSRFRGCLKMLGISSGLVTTEGIVGGCSRVSFDISHELRTKMNCLLISQRTTTNHCSGYNACIDHCVMGRTQAPGINRAPQDAQKTRSWPEGDLCWSQGPWSSLVSAAAARFVSLVLPRKSQPLGQDRDYLRSTNFSADILTSSLYDSWYPRKVIDVWSLACAERSLDEGGTSLQDD